MRVDGERYRAQIAARVPSEMEERLQRLAYDRSEPMNQVTVSDLVREALAETYGIEAET